MLTAPQLIQQYNLQPHPEGGWYKETYRSSEHIEAAALPKRFGRSRAFSTAIYFLLEQGDFSAFHRIKSDECWHSYAGDPLQVYVLQPNGNLDIITLGNNIFQGHSFNIPCQPIAGLPAVLHPAAVFVLLAARLPPVLILQILKWRMQQH